MPLHECGLLYQSFIQRAIVLVRFSLKSPISFMPSRDEDQAHLIMFNLVACKGRRRIDSVSGSHGMGQSNTTPVPWGLHALLCLRDVLRRIAAI